MLKNYFKIAIAVLKRRKFFTFISLFGISFTLATLLVLTSFLDKVINDEYPDAKRSRSIYVTGIEERGKGTRSSSALSLGYVNKYILHMKTPAAIAFHSMQIGTNAYHNGKKISVNYKFVNSVFWDIMEFDFLQGKPFSAQQVNSLDKVAVISQDLSDAYFGIGEPAVGKYLEVGNDKYRISGVVKNVPATAYMLNGDMYIPYTLSQDNPNEQTYFGSWNAVLLARSKSDMPLIQKEYEDIIARLPHSDKRFTKTLSNADEYLDAYMRAGNQDGKSKTWIYTALGIFVFLIVLLPVVNLVNINITRIMERSSEIAVRKAFGATANTLVYQFIVENIILTLLGGLFGLLLAQFFLWILNGAALLTNVHLTLNLTVLFTGLLICLIFGFLSGVYPAWRMSRFPIIKALKA
ncbi:putative ABC transport system permease protein [Chitinophaga dinghuensis]|uniref:Putative ABC transport system permease protein n=1 Tax=Chitinophaga dinghuensis TaxID=1539050 RepID=A0A327VQI7_9BACT|nr:ABC transporter permease [Chitinophaga dinghuensis]RAJ76704.1 putative ABC transport system permease protein [Chitinophaga dinghuensis]